MSLEFIGFLNTVPVDYMVCVEFVVCMMLLFFLLKFFGLFGLYAFIIAALFVCNIQVLKIVKYSFYPEPIALGKVVICCIFLAMDIIVECYGKQKAQYGIWLGLSSNIMVSVMMVITMGYTPFLSEDIAYASFNLQSQSIDTIFSPMPSILIAGIISYLISQFVDISVFAKLKKVTKGKYLWLRSLIAPALSSLLDNAIFYSLAFYFLSSKPLKLNILIYSYIIGTYLFRLSFIFISSHMMYLAVWIINRRRNKRSISSHFSYQLEVINS